MDLIEKYIGENKNSIVSSGKGKGQKTKQKKRGIL